MAVVLLLAMGFIAWGRRGRLSMRYSDRNKQVTA